MPPSVCRALWAVLLLALAACDTATPAPDDPSGDDARRPLALADLLAPTTAAEVEAVLADWAERDTRARGVRIEAEGTSQLGTIPVRYTVVSHTVGGVRHVGAILVPAALPADARVPVMVYTHGGYSGPGGAPYDATSFPAQFLAGGDRLVWVVPAFRSERIAVEGTVYAAEGEPSIGNYDVDDALALLSVALDRTPQADGARVGVLGESRGALVALEMGARDSRIDLVLDAYGPTDLRIAAASVNLTEEQFRASVRESIGAPFDFDNLITSALIPLDQVAIEADGSVSATEAGFREMRLRMARTTVLAYVERLPVTEVHHGVLDFVASVEHSRALARAFQAAGRPSGSPGFRYYEYPFGGHDVFTLLDVAPRLSDAIARVLAP